MIKRGISLLAASVFVLVPLSAQASHTSPADLGHFADPGDETCFQDAWGAMINVGAAPGRPCPGGTRRFVIPVHTYWAGWQTADVSVTARDVVSCQMITAKDGERFDIGAVATSRTPGRPELLHVGASFADKNPGWILCSVSPGSQVNHVWFSGS